jgi:ATP-dependent RNA helicase DDX54/DBP10
MPHRAASPALSENEFDITKSLFKDDDAEGNADLEMLAGGGILDMGLESDGDGDEEFIASQQAASNRKAANVKGKSVKKGGGFQAMGELLDHTNLRPLLIFHRSEHTST